MDTFLIKRKFARMGARLKLGATRPAESVIDIGRDRRGEFFAIDRGRDTEIQVLDVRPAQRHLLLQLVDGDGAYMSLKALRDDNPAAFWRMVAGLLPRQFRVEAEVDSEIKLTWQK